MMMMKEGIFAGHPSLALPPLHLASLALALLALAPLAFAPLHLPLPCTPLKTKMAKHELKQQAKMAKRDLKWQKVS